MEMCANPRIAVVDRQPLRDSLGGEVLHIKPLKPVPIKSDDIFVNSEQEFVEQLRGQLSIRPEVWGVGLWPDDESEMIARECSELFLEVWGLPVKMIPEDPLGGLAEYGEEMFGWALDFLENEYACEIDWRELERKNVVTLAGLVAMIKERKGTKPPKPAPWGWLGELLEWCWPILVLAGLIAMAMLVKS